MSELFHGGQTHLNYNSAASLRAFLDENGLGMRKKYGQNFLINPGVRKALVDALDVTTPDPRSPIPDPRSVWEIGPGLGAMTRLLLDSGYNVCAFEIDPGFAKALRGLFSGDDGFTLVEGDVLKTWRSQGADAPYLLGNLPYNIAATLLADLIENKRYFKSMVVTVQREVAQRMTAAVGTKNYSSFSVLCASAYKVQPLMTIKGASFYPRPNVDSQGVLLELREDAVLQELPRCFYPLLRRLFSSRRKTVKNNLEEFLCSRGSSGGRELPVAAVLEKSGIDGRSRPENLAFEDFAVLAKTIENMESL
jgi:16S rRNA (adenine1518-N6/adenine1519-N6)-dimethyltransferase